MRHCDNYRIIDQSDDLQSAGYLKGKDDENLSFTENSGTSLINYLDFIIQEHEQLPPLVSFLEGNVIGRHINHSEFEERKANDWDTYLWQETLPRELTGPKL